MTDTLNGLRTHTLSALRIMTGLLFLAHGTQKLLNYPAPPGWEVATFSLPWIAGAMELVGGALIVIGLFTRPVAFLLSGLMAVAYFMAHAPENFHPILNGGELAVLYCFIFLFFVTSGPGKWSVDEMMRR